MDNKLLNIKMSENETIKSTELVDIINEFRKVESDATGKKYRELAHYDFYKKIEKEINTLESAGINDGNFSVVEYIDKKGEKRPCYELTKNGMLEMLNSESAIVRHKTIEYIERLENEVRNLKEAYEYNNLLKETKELKETAERVIASVGIQDRHTKMYSRYIKTRLGINRVNNEYKMVQKRLFKIMDVDRWEQLAVKDMKYVYDCIDEALKIINEYKQMKLEIKE
jgi:phage regulator Rha-like protein